MFHIQHVPSDTQMREILDGVPPDELRPLFNAVLHELQRGKVLRKYAFHEGAYLLSMDGTGYFSSTKIHCASCQERVNRRTGEVTYQHQMLGAVLVHPDRKEVIPLAPEPIQKQDGSTKNDCEQNAAKRLLEKIRREHPRLNMIVAEDSLASHAPHIRLPKAIFHPSLGQRPRNQDHVVPLAEGHVHPPWRRLFSPTRIVRRTQYRSVSASPDTRPEKSFVDDGAPDPPAYG